jgi:hypothetical protein
MKVSGGKAVAPSLLVDDVEFAENPNSVFIDPVGEYHVSHNAAHGFGWVITKLDEV